MCGVRLIVPMTSNVIKVKCGLKKAYVASKIEMDA